MATIKEDYVSFETAKLLKEKGFGWDWSPFYSKQDKDEWEQNNSYTIANPNYDVTIPFDSETLNVVVPHVSLQMAMKWLREVHGLHISLEPCYDYDSVHVVFLAFVQNVADVHEFMDGRKNVASYPNAEKSYELAIKYCLENLI